MKNWIVKKFLEQKIEKYRVGIKALNVYYSSLFVNNNYTHDVYEDIKLQKRIKIEAISEKIEIIKKVINYFNENN